MKKDIECLKCDKFFDSCEKSPELLDYKENNHKCLYFVKRKEIEECEEYKLLINER